MITRRTFIKTTTYASVAAMLSPGLVRAASPKKDTGLQLYTVRDQLAANLPGTLRGIARIGYTWLEAAGYGNGTFYGLAPAEFKKIVNDLGMEIISSHAGYNAEGQQQAIDAHAELGVKYLVCPSFPVDSMETREDFLKAAERLNEIGAGCHMAGFGFGYHNHDKEFLKIDDTTGYHILLESTDKRYVMFEADIYWMAYANVEPHQYFREYPGRFVLWHVKDMENSPDRGFTEVGDGIIPYHNIFNEAGQAGMEYFFVEQDTCKMDPMRSIRISYKNLQKILS